VVPASGALEEAMTEISMRFTFLAADGQPSGRAIGGDRALLRMGYTHLPKYR
jgi:hypothetical protein